MSKNPDNATELSKTLHQLIETVRLIDAPDDVLDEANNAIQALTDFLKPHQSQGLPCAAMLDGDLNNYEQRAKNPQEVMPYSPVIGTLNPVSPGFEFHYVDGDSGSRRVEGAGTFPASFTGPPGTAHGGLVAAAFDEILTAVVIANGSIGFTGTLNVRYVNRTEVLKEVSLSAEVTKTEGRKIFTKAEMHQGGQLTATSEAVFIKA